MVLQVLRHLLAGIQTRFDLRVSNVTTYDDRTIEREARADRVLGQDLAYIRHRLVQVNANSIALSGVTQFGGNKRGGIVVHLLDPYAIAVDLALDVSVSRAAYTQTYRAAGTVTRQTNYSYVVSHILATELCTKTDLICLLQQAFLQFYIAESTTCLVARSGQSVIVVRRCQLNRQQVLLRTRTANNESNMIRRTSSCTQALHLLNEEGNKCTFVLDAGFGLLVEISFVCRTAALGHAQELVLHALRCLDINLCRQVALGIHLVEHIQRSILAVAQVALSIGVEHTAAQSFLVAESRPNLLTFLAVDNGCTGILA